MCPSSFQLSLRTLESDERRVIYDQYLPGRRIRNLCFGMVATRLLPRTVIAAAGEHAQSAVYRVIDVGDMHLVAHYVNLQVADNH